MKKPDLATGSKIFVAFIAATALAGGGLCYWQYGQTQETADKFAKREKEVGDEASVRRRLQEAAISLEQARAEVQFLEQSVSDEWYVPTLIKQLEAGAKSVNLKLVGIRPQAPKQTPAKQTEEEKKKEAEDGTPRPKPERKPYRELDLQISVAGNFWDIMRFLKDLNTFPKILSVRQIQLAPRANAPGVAGSDDLDAQMIVRAFVFSRQPDSSARANSGTTTTTPGGGLANGG